MEREGISSSFLQALTFSGEEGGIYLSGNMYTGKNLINVDTQIVVNCRNSVLVGTLLELKARRIMGAAENLKA